MILAPTRELAQQIEVEAVKMAKFTDYRFVSVVGGAPAIHYYVIRHECVSDFCSLEIPSRRFMSGTIDRISLMTKQIQGSRGLRQLRQWCAHHSTSLPDWLE